MQGKTKLKNAVFIQAYNKLKEAGFYDEFAKTLNLKPKTPNKSKTAVAGRKIPELKESFSAKKNKKTVRGSTVEKISLSN
jgi:hypothetical protein